MLLGFAPVWIRLLKLPLEFWDRACLFTVASALGRPIKLYGVTLSGSKKSFARICVEIDLEAAIPEGIWIDDCLGSFWQQVVYEHVPGVKPRCFRCGAGGRKGAQCSNQVNGAHQSSIIGDSSKPEPKTCGIDGEEEGWRVKSKRKSTTF